MLFRSTAVYPVFHVLSALNCASGSTLRPSTIASAGKAAALAWENKEGRWLLVANLTAGEQAIKLSGVSAKASVGMLDALSFVDATSAPVSFRERSHWISPSGDLVLDAYAVACIFDQ